MIKKHIPPIAEKSSKSTKRIWSPAIKIILKSKGGKREKKKKKNRWEAEREREDSVSEDAQKRL